MGAVAARAPMAGGTGAVARQEQGGPQGAPGSVRVGRAGELAREEAATAKAEAAKDAAVEKMATAQVAMIKATPMAAVATAEEAMKAAGAAKKE